MRISSKCTTGLAVCSSFSHFCGAIAQKSASSRLYTRIKRMETTRPRCLDKISHVRVCVCVSHHKVKTRWLPHALLSFYIFFFLSNMLRFVATCCRIFPVYHQEARNFQQDLRECTQADKRGRKIIEKKLRKNSSERKLKKRRDEKRRDGTGTEREERLL